MGGDSGDKLGDYVAVLEREAKQNGELPKVEIKCDLSYTLKLPASKVDRDIVTVPEVFASAALAPVKAAARALGAAPNADSGEAIQHFKVLQNVTGTFRPGEITLLLAPPGHGKTSLLKAISHQLRPGAVGVVDGPGVTYNGLTADELTARGVDVARLTCYVEQVDTHLPFINVGETAKFIHDNGEFLFIFVRAIRLTSCFVYSHPGAHRSITTLRQARRGDQPTGAGGMHRHHRGQRLGARCVRRGEEARDHIGSARHQRQGALHG